MTGVLCLNVNDSSPMHDCLPGSVWLSVHAISNLQDNSVSAAYKNHYGYDLNGVCRGQAEGN
jgi:hypothetical protein